VFLDTSTLEPHDDQWAYPSSLGRLSPREVTRLAQRLGSVTVGVAVKRLGQPTSTRTVPEAPPIVRVRLRARVTVQGEDLTPAQHEGRVTHSEAWTASCQASCSRTLAGVSLWRLVWRRSCGAFRSFA
jgi:hypothetical protein